ncbi:Quercetin 2,3-dioxygenase [Thalassocella blandensis]|nr:Quercetin 2,3-dioxygenase [Thalassocella blandensis]
MSTRKIIEQLKARPASDGDGVKLLRVFGGQQPQRFDPFLMMDEFGSDVADDYIGGFPPHPHRGFETITYMLQGKMEHRDHMENVGLLKDGDVQWMTAGKGVIHSEMPQQTEGKMRGFQVWLNLPAKNKLTPAKYRDVSSEKIPVTELEDVFVKAIAGQTTLNGTEIKGYFDVPDTEPVFLDVHIAKGKQVNFSLPEGHNALLYAYEGSLAVGDAATPSPAQTLSRLSDTGEVLVKNSGDSEARFVILAGKPLKEPIAQYGPFVMNTAEEINQAVMDYRNGVLA